MSQPRAIPVLLAALTLLVGSAVAAHAAPAARTQLCHAVPGAVGHVVLTLPDAALAAHLAEHEDDGVVGVDVDEDCQPLPDEPTVLARAWSVDAGGADVLIAQLEDAAADGVPSVGDVVRAGSYPLDVTGTAYGTFTVQEHVVDRVLYVSPRMVRVAVGDAQFEWNVDDGTGAELYLEQRGRALTLVGDGRTDRKPVDIVIVSPGSPSAPAHSLFVGAFSVADDDLVNVELRLG